MIFYCIAVPLFAEEPIIQGTFEFELTTPARENSFGETIGAGEYNWRTAPLALGRLSGFGRYEQSDSRAEWTTRHTLAYAPVNSAPFLALAVEYGANQRHDFWQGGIQFVGQRVPAIREYFQHLALAYFTRLHDAPASSEWMARFGTQQIPLTRFAALFVEGIYRYRPSEKRARDVGSAELWFVDTVSCSPIKGCFDLGVSLEKTDLTWTPFLGMRFRF